MHTAAVAATALEVLPLADLKAELRIEAGDSTHDALLTGQIGAAVSFVGRFTRAPLLNQTETHRCPRPGADQPIGLATDHVQAVAPIRYWSAGTDRRLVPDGSIALTDLGRRVQVGPRFCIWPPAGGWPEVEDGSVLEVDLTRALEITPQTQTLRQAVILCCRTLYDQEPLIKPTAAMYALIGPWRRMDADPPSTLVTVA